MIRLTMETNRLGRPIARNTNVSLIDSDASTSRDRCGSDGVARNGMAMSSNPIGQRNQPALPKSVSQSKTSMSRSGS